VHVGVGFLRLVLADVLNEGVRRYLDAKIHYFTRLRRWQLVTPIDKICCFEREIHHLSVVPHDPGMMERRIPKSRSRGYSTAAQPNFRILDRFSAISWRFCAVSPGLGNAPFRKVAEQHGWPVSMPYECAVALFSNEQVAAARAYLEANKGRFKVKNKGG